MMPSLKPQNRFPSSSSDHFTHFLGIAQNLNDERVNRSTVTRLSITKYCLWTCFFALLVSSIYFFCIFFANDDTTFYQKNKLYYVAISSWFILYLSITFIITFIQIQYQFPVSSIPRSHCIVYIIIVFFINCCLFLIMIYLMILSNNDKLADLDIKYLILIGKYERIPAWNLFYLLLHSAWLIIDLLLCLFVSQIACFSLNLSHYSSIKILKSHNGKNL